VNSRADIELRSSEYDLCSHRAAAAAIAELLLDTSDERRRTLMIYCASGDRTRSEIAGELEEIQSDANARLHGDVVTLSSTRLLILSFFFSIEVSRLRAFAFYLWSVVGLSVWKSLSLSLSLWGDGDGTTRRGADKSRRGCGPALLRHGAWRRSEKMGQGRSALGVRLPTALTPSAPSAARGSVGRLSAYTYKF